MCGTHTTWMWPPGNMTPGQCTFGDSQCCSTSTFGQDNAKILCVTCIAGYISLLQVIHLHARTCMSGEFNRPKCRNYQLLSQTRQPGHWIVVCIERRNLSSPFEGPCQWHQNQVTRPSAPSQIARQAITSRLS